MEPIRHLADTWMPLFGIHLLEISAFILLVWATDRLLRLDTRLRYALYLLALVKAFVPPLFLLPAPPPVPVVAPPEPLFVAPPLSDPVPPPIAPGPAPTLPLSVLFLGLWAASVLVMVTITLYQNLALRRRLRRVAPVTRPLIPLQIFSCPAISAPVLVGLFRPRLYLPEDWATWPDPQLRGILAHELAHLRARDPYALVLQTLALALFGLNPLVWLLCARLTYLRELRCDEAAVRETGLDPLDYSKLLYTFAEKQARPPRLAVAGTSFSESHPAILKRFQHVLNLKEGPMRPRKPWHYLAPALLALIILPLSVQGRAKPSYIVETIAPDDQQSTKEPSSFQSGERKSGFGEFPETERPDDYIPKPDAFVRVDTQPVPISQPRPQYPEAARRDSLEGVVFLNILISREGKVLRVETIQRGEPFKGEELFKQAAIEAAKKSTWKPATRKGKPVTVWVAYPIKFTLKGGPPPGARPLEDRGQRPSNPPDTTKAETKFGPTQIQLMLKQINTFRAESGDSIVVEKAPRPVRFTFPKHPEAAKKAGIEGAVKLQYLVGKDGRATHIEVLQGEYPFKQAAVEAIQAAVWEPATYKGEPVAVWKVWSYPFRLLKYKAESGDTIIVDQGASLLQLSRPVYPPAALKDSLEGVVYLNVLVGEEGRVKQAEVARGEEVFKQAAVEAIQAATWKPAMQDGKPVSVWTSFTLPFGIKKGVPPSPEAFIPVDEQPRPIAQPRPVYPEAARRDSLEGVVFLNMLIGRDGKVLQVETIQRGEPFKGEELFKQAAIQAGKESLWLPAIHKGQPVSVWVAYPIRFTLK